jgi:hypothetical protein
MPEQTGHSGLRLQQPQRTEGCRTDGRRQKPLHSIMNTRLSSRAPRTPTTCSDATDATIYNCRVEEIGPECEAYALRHPCAVT